MNNNYDNTINDSEKKYNIAIYTDGACSGNPGKGGWGAILIYNKKKQNGDNKEIKKIISGSNNMTTNNIMELTAVIEALKIIKKPSKITLFSDSKYVINGATQWLQKWQTNRWLGANKKPIKNVELWQDLLKLSTNHEIQWNWVKGHSTDPVNNEVDLIARSESKKNN